MDFSFIYKKILNISIKWKLTIIITALMIGLLILLTWTHISAQKKIMFSTLERHINVMRDNLISTGKILMENLIINVEKDMAVLNFSNVIESINTVVNTNDTVKASILMDNNRTAILNSNNSQLVNCVLEDDISKEVTKLKGLHMFNYQKDYIEIVSHVQFSTKPWGHLRLILNLQPLITEIKQSEKQIQSEIYSIIKRSLINALIFMSISFMLVYYICRRITKKLINLTHSAELLSKGNFSVEIQKSSGNDEIAILQRSFAIMASNLKSLIRRLNNYNKKLESTVEERTMELKASEKKYKGLYNSSKDGIFYINLENTFQNANYAFSRLSGYSSSQLKKLKLNNLVEDKYTNKIEQVINEIKQKGFSREIELNICHKSGKLIPIAIHAWLLKDNTGKPDGIWGFGRDISEKKSAEKLREDVEKMIQHDIKSPLNGIIGLSSLIMDINEMNETSIQYIENIKELSLNTIQLIDNSLNMHKIELGTYQIEAIDCDLISMLLRFQIECVTMMKVKNLRIDYLYENNAFHENSKITCFVSGEKLLLKNLFGNLIKNAIEASPKNETITINIFRTGKEIEIRINNQGIIPENIRTNFFDYFIFTC
ncbi:multi-sensor signal transduction histidine kinase [Candidatus Magnetomorum sp. HK-1]|nr:multi-sensor signal transduction histidine kinase [Candidatus Magnetomorum sp. HK-1]